MTDPTFARPPAYCPACLEPAPNDAAYHPDCLLSVFGVPRLPALSLTRDDIPARAEESVGKLSISGAQPKLLLTLSADGTALVPVDTDSYFLLKPQQGRQLHHIVENEHATMHLARRCGIPVPAFTLVTLSDDSPAYLTRRFDRPPPPARGRYRMEEFAALAEHASHDKYEGTMEQCADLVHRHSGDPAADLRDLFRRAVFNVLTGNGDMHLKNFALLKLPGQPHRLSPAYDLVSTQFYRFEEHFHDDLMALTMRSGSTGEPKRKELTGKDFLAYADHCRIPHDEARALVHGLLQTLADAPDLLRRTALPPSMQQRYAQLLHKRGLALQQGLDPRPPRS